MSEESIHSFLSELRKVMSDAEALLEANAADVGDQAHLVRDKLSASMHDAQHAMQRIQEQLSTQVSKATDNANQYVHENPWTSIGLAGAAGLLVGLLVRRR